MRLFMGFLALLSFSASAQTETPLDRSLRPPMDADTEISPLYREMGVVQRRAMPKDGRFLLSSYGSFDFSDGPYTYYGFNFNPGYAFSDFLEVYLQTTPFFFSSARDIVEKVAALQLNGGARASITAARPKQQYGVEVLWAPLYGKDSMGIKRVLRSDTFFKFGVAQIRYDSDTGLRFIAGVGKTFFLGRSLGLRVSANATYWQTIVDNVKSFRTIAVLEGGVVGYF